MEKIKVASLFCGCGGMDLGVIGGFSYLGKEYKENPFEIVYAVDNDEYCTKIYNDNFTHKCEVKDVRDIKIGEMPQFDMLIGGFPCQSFSISAQNPPRLGYKDERGMLFFEMVKILKERQPRFFIAENVKGMMTLHKGQIFNRIIKSFEEVGYTTYTKLFNAADYGVPQKRERVIIVGIRNDLNDVMEYEFPKETNKNNWVPLSVAVPKLAIEQGKYYFSERAVQGMKKAKNNMKRGLYQDLNKPCLTVTSHLAKVSLNSRDPVLLVNPEKEVYRRFTPLEAARIQSFPDEFIFAGSETDAYRQIGNAIPPVMFWHIAKSIEEYLSYNGEIVLNRKAI